MTLAIRLLVPDDAALLDDIAADDADFDLDDRGGTEERLSIDQLREYLADPTVLHWIAYEGEGVATCTSVLGFLHCQTVRKYAGQPMELLLYEIGVRTSARRKGVGRALQDAMEAWMKERNIPEVWVLGDNPGAVAFYKACGFESHDPEDAVYLTRDLG